MKLEVLIGSLDNPQPAVRLDVARVLGMLDEVQALDALRQRFQVETDPSVRNAIAWAGKRLYEAQQAAYSTVEEVCRHFGVDREIENMPDAQEAEMMKKLQDNFDAEMIRMQDQNNKKKAGMALAAGLGGAMVGGMTMGMSAAMGSMSGGLIGSPSSNMEARPQIGTKRNPATMPSKSDISVWAKRLREASSVDVRENAAIELAQLNNPMALPHLAAAFVNDPEVKVREAAQRFGKVLYWNMIYWEMEQDGSMAEEMKRRAEKIGKNIEAKSSTGTGPLSSGSPAADTPFAAPQRPAEAPQEDINEILRRAKEGRAKRLGGK